MNLDKPRQPAGTPIGGRFAVTTRAETGLSLTADPEVVSAGAAALLGHEPDGGPDAMAAMQASETVLRAAESHLASRLGGLPTQRPPHQCEPWQVRDDGAGPYCTACGQPPTTPGGLTRWDVAPEPDEVDRADEPAPVFRPERFGPRPSLVARLGGEESPEPDDEPATVTPQLRAAAAREAASSWQAAEYTIRSETNLEDAVRAARRDAVQLDRPQTIDHPAGTTWKRTTIYPNGERSETGTVPPYTRNIDHVAAMVRPDELAAATLVVMDHPDRDPHTVAAMAADEVTPQFRPHVEALFTQLLTQHLKGRPGVNRDILARIPDTTPGAAALRAHETQERVARAAAAARFAGHLGA